jgi:hypothetical protein
MGSLFGDIFGDGDGGAPFQGQAGQTVAESDRQVGGGRGGGLMVFGGGDGGDTQTCPC